MDPLDRYLEAVKKHLPWQRQDDIIAELRANLEAQLEDKEAELGRPLTKAEMEAWIKQMGAPMRMAARYGPRQYLIGPDVFPTYWYVLRTAFLWVVVIYSVVSALLIVVQTPAPGAVVEAVLRLPGILLITGAWITLIFAVIEFAVTHYPAACQSIAGSSIDWLPGALPALDKQPAPGKKQRSHAHAAAEVVFGYLGLVWLLLVPQYPVLLWGPGAAYLRSLPFQLAPVWVEVYWWIIGLNMLQLAWRSWDLWRGSWRQPNLVQNIAIKAVGLVPLVLLITVKDHAWITLKHAALDQARYGANLEAINRAIHLGMSLVCAIVVLQLLWDIGRMGLGLYRKHAAAML